MPAIWVPLADRLPSSPVANSLGCMTPQLAGWLPSCLPAQANHLLDGCLAWHPGRTAISPSLKFSNQFLVLAKWKFSKISILYLRFCSDLKQNYLQDGNSDSCTALGETSYELTCPRSLNRSVAEPGTHRTSPEPQSGALSTKPYCFYKCSISIAHLSHWEGTMGKGGDFNVPNNNPRYSGRF